MRTLSHWEYQILQPVIITKAKIGVSVSISSYRPEVNQTTRRTYLDLVQGTRHDGDLEAFLGPFSGQRGPEARTITEDSTNFGSSHLFGMRDANK